MKKIFCVIAIAVVLAGCASAAFKTARENANRVTNGMTVAEATAILGMPPTQIASDSAWWRRGNALVYTGKSSGAIRFKLMNGVITGLPSGGVFGPGAEEQVQAEVQEEALAARADRESTEARKRKKLKDEIDAEAAAIAHSSVACRDKDTCTKAFALAQIFVTENSDQKIQVATDTIIETYNPTEDGKLGIKIVKMPGSGAAEVLSITPHCRASEFFESACRLRRTLIYLTFRPYIESRLGL
jgi:hypothetical protein